MKHFRHAQLFELLRQQNVSELAQARSQQPVDLSRIELAGLLAISVKSWTAPGA
ncbi:MAG: hypothetical protein JKY94_15905 [Rhodobacteraceae bacterium]|nr:hypothetical protein [Paracoccaceae bacterium]